MHAYATLGVMPKRLVPACAHELKRRLPCARFILQDLGQLLWSLCILEVRPPTAAIAALPPAGSEATGAHVKAAGI